MVIGVHAKLMNLGGGVRIWSTKYGVEGWGGWYESEEKLMWEYRARGLPEIIFLWNSNTILFKSNEETKTEKSLKKYEEFVFDEDIINVLFKWEMVMVWVGVLTIFRKYYSNNCSFQTKDYKSESWLRIPHRFCP